MCQCHLQNFAGGGGDSVVIKQWGQSEFRQNDGLMSLHGEPVCATIGGSMLMGVKNCGCITLMVVQRSADGFAKAILGSYWVNM